MKTKINLAHQFPAENNSWEMMIQRCTNPKATGYENYGGRGIKVSPRWRSFKRFLEDMGQRPPGTTLDRIDTNGDYEPDNCKWSTKSEQQRNRRDSLKAPCRCGKKAVAKGMCNTCYNREWRI